jgi:hypothetical protein
MITKSGPHFVDGRSAIGQKTDTLGEEALRHGGPAF